MNLMKEYKFSVDTVHESGWTGLLIWSVWSEEL